MPEPSSLFKTPTVARIYAQQGKFEQARTLYHELLAKDLGDAQLANELAHELGKVELQLAGGTSNLVGERDTLMLTHEAGSLFCSWLLSEGGIENAQLLLGSSPGDLTLRVAGFPHDAPSIVRDISIEREKDSARIPPPVGATYVTASVGLMDSEGTFVSIAHCDMLPI
ncbi:MAG: hypothetical protein JRH20_19245 [Deltaproteobacteria bacterium]|nr:hypothetical protein [Deltaproteobacteria bacterium]